MAKSNALVISCPMDPKHVGGINVTGGKQPSILDSYFSKTALEPDEVPSHTYAATGNIEVPKRSDTIAGAIRRPNVSLKRNLSKLRRKSLSHVSEIHSLTQSNRNTNGPIARSESVKTKDNTRSLRMQSSLSHLRQRLGLDRELHESATISKPIAAEPERAPAPIEKDYPPLQTRKPLSRATSHASSKYPEPKRQVMSNSVQRKPSSVQQEASAIQRRLPPASQEPLAISSTSKQQVPPKRADSGTAIALDEIPVLERPLPFKEIMAVKRFTERMALYKRTREYWAYADHGLIEWTSRASGPKNTHGRIQRSV
jgi:hypothetical protein